jgi:hypothetical protein
VIELFQFRRVDSADALRDDRISTEGFVAKPEMSNV